MTQPLALDNAPAGEAAGWRRNEDIIDALPYVDTLSDAEKVIVDKLIREEMKNSEKKVGDYLRELPPAPKLNLESHPMLQSELARVRAGGAMQALDLSRCLLDPPTARADVGTWKKALDNAHSQLEHQYLRLSNLELLYKYGASVWQVHNNFLEAHNKRLEQQAADVGQRIDQTNRERKLHQTGVGADLTDLEAEWQSLITKNRDIESACAALEAEIKLLEPALEI